MFVLFLFIFCAMVIDSNWAMWRQLLSIKENKHCSSTHFVFRLQSSHIMNSKEIAHLEWYMKMLSIPPKNHHFVKAGESHFSKVHLGFSEDAWIEIVQKYFKTHTDLDIDFSVNPDAQEICLSDPYFALYRNIPSGFVVDVKVAISDYLQDKNCLIVKTKDLELTREKLQISPGKWLEILDYLPGKDKMDKTSDLVNVLDWLCERHCHRQW